VESEVRKERLRVRVVGGTECISPKYGGYYTESDEAEAHALYLSKVRTRI
jgi:hypothetical protein